jgi:hypothetical protein
LEQLFKYNGFQWQSRLPCCQHMTKDSVSVHPVLVNSTSRRWRFPSLVLRRRVVCCQCILYLWQCLTEKRWRKSAELNSPSRQEATDWISPSLRKSHVWSLERILEKSAVRAEAFVMPKQLLVTCTRAGGSCRDVPCHSSFAIHLFSRLEFAG